MWSDIDIKGKRQEQLSSYNAEHSAYCIYIVFSWSVIHHARQKHFFPPLESPLIAVACAPVKESRDGTFVSHLSEWLKGY